MVFRFYYLISQSQTNILEAKQTGGFLNYSINYSIPRVLYNPSQLQYFS